MTLEQIEKNVEDKQKRRTECFQGALDYIDKTEMSDNKYENEYLCVVDGCVVKQGTKIECEKALETVSFKVAYINIIDQITGEASWKYFDINQV